MYQTTAIPTFPIVPLVEGRNYGEHLRIRAERELQVQAQDLALSPPDPSAVERFKDTTAQLTPYALGELAVVVSEAYSNGFIGWEHNPDAHDPCDRRGVYGVERQQVEYRMSSDQIIANAQTPMRVVYESQNGGYGEYEHGIEHQKAIREILYSAYVDLATDPARYWDLQQYIMGEKMSNTRITSPIAF